MPVRTRLHHHDCVSCGHQYACDGEYERNHDGWPEAVCVEFHERWRRVCDDCRNRTEDDADGD